jgi:hypothetical protein
MRELARSKTDTSTILTLRNSFLGPGFISTKMSKKQADGDIKDFGNISADDQLGAALYNGDVCLAINESNLIYLVWVVDINKPFDKVLYSAEALDSADIIWSDSVFIYKDAPNYYPNDSANDDISFGTKGKPGYVTARGKTKWLCLANPAVPILYTFGKKQGVGDATECNNNTTAPEWYDGSSNDCEWKAKFLSMAVTRRPDAIPNAVISVNPNFVPNTMAFNYVARKKWMLYTGIPLIVFGIGMMVMPYIIKGKPSTATTSEATASEATASEATASE